MIYLDNAATSRFKPQTVLRAVINELKNGANPGRGAHSDSIRAAAAVMNARAAVRTLAGDPQAEVVFTKNCTEALNLAIFGTLKNGGHIIATDNEHNSVLRPLFELKRLGKIRLTILPSGQYGAPSAKDVENALTPETYLVCVNHISNVTGAKADVRSIGRLTAERGILLLVDGAQSLGHAEIDMKKYGIDMLAAAGHKGLHGPQGTGFLAFNRGLAAAENNTFYGGIALQNYEENNGGVNGIESQNDERNNGFFNGIESQNYEKNNGVVNGAKTQNYEENNTEKNGLFRGIVPRNNAENGEPFKSIAPQNYDENKVILNVGNNAENTVFQERKKSGFSGKITLKPILFGGTGTASDSVYQPSSAPEAFESGTVNTPGICGLAEGIKWTLENKKEIEEKIRVLSRELLNGLASIKKVILYTAQNDLNGVVSFNVEGMTSSDAGDILNENYGIAVRTGLHCAPLVHNRLKTLKNGAVRVGIGYVNTRSDIKKLLSAVNDMTR